MCVGKTDSAVLTQEHGSQLGQVVLGVSPDVPGQQDEQRPQGVSTYLEVWAAHCGTCRDRRQGQRVLHFDEQLSDVADQVTACLAALAVMSETVATEAWRGRIADGFCVISAFI